MIAALLPALVVAALPEIDQLKCDVLIAGGSTAALAAALTAAEADPNLEVCLAEPTDWPGGQMTAAGVSAIDYGAFNRLPENQPRSFRELIAALEFPWRQAGAANPGCWVSLTCYPPQSMVQWVERRMAAIPNLKLFKRTVVRASERGSDGYVRGVLLVQRTPKSGYLEWSNALSDEIVDWYDPEPSSRFTKRRLNVTAQVVIDATELGDVLLTAGLEVGQGVELPDEVSPPGGSDQCGQAATLTFFTELLSTPTVDPAPQGSRAGGAAFSNHGCCCPTISAAPYQSKRNATNLGAGTCDSAGIWSYRRAFTTALKQPSYQTIVTGDVTQQNWGNPSGNDLDNAYLLLPLELARADVTADQWAGGFNLTALKMLEDRAYGWFRGYAAAVPNGLGSRMVLNRTFTATSHGLSKFPYLRDTRRSVGLDGYRLTHTDQYPAAKGSRAAARPTDAVALGNYDADIHWLNDPAKPDCGSPAYMRRDGSKTVPYYVPFRALTHRDAPNLLVAGKTIAATFYANAAARLHPEEWATGVAAGAASVQMARGQLSTAALLATGIPALQSLLNGTTVGAPLEWTL